jgi:hypothetical protein
MAQVFLPPSPANLSFAAILSCILASNVAFKQALLGDMMVQWLQVEMPESFR